MIKLDLTRELPPWTELLLYLVGGLGIFTLCSYGIHFFFTEITLWLSLTVFCLNVVCLGGCFYFLGVRRGKVTLSQLGLFPARWHWRWLLAAIVLSIIFIPIRSIIGAMVEFLLVGNFESLTIRSAILTGGGDFSWFSFALNFLGAALVVPISEELYFRGLIHSMFQRYMDFWPRMLLSSALFGLAHVDSIGVIISSFILGLVNAAAYEKSKSLWLPIVMHMITNGFAISFVYLAKFLGI